MSLEGFEKLQHILGDLAGHAHGKSCALVQEMPVKALTFHLWLTLRLCLKQKVKAKIVL